MPLFRFSPRATGIRKRPLLLCLAAGALGVAAGCSTYEAKPLDRAAVAAALQAPKIEAVKDQAARLRHPLLSPVAIDGTDGFSPDEIAVMVVIVSPELRALRDQQGVAEAQVLQAGILPNPQLGYTLDEPHGNYAPPVVSALSLGLSWEVTSLLTHHDQVAAARADAKSLNLSIAWQEWQTAQEARLRAFRILSLEQRRPLAQAVEDGLAGTLALTKKALRLGYKTTSDLTAATDAWTQAQNARFDLDQQLTAERAALNLSLGLPADQTLRLKAAAMFPALPADSRTEAAALLDGLEDRRLDLVALRYGYESQEATLRAAVLAQFPKIGLSLNQGRDTTPIYTRGVGVNVDLPLFDRNQGQIAIGRATRQQLFDEYVARVAEARSEVGQILADLAVTRAQLQAADASLPDLRNLVDSFATALKTGDADLPASLDAQGALANREMEQSRLRQEVLELSVALEIATGRPLLNHPVAQP